MGKRRYRRRSLTQCGEISKRAETDLTDGKGWLKEWDLNFWGTIIGYETLQEDWVTPIITEEGIVKVTWNPCIDR